MILNMFKTAIKTTVLISVIGITLSISVIEKSNAQRRDYNNHPYTRSIPSQIKFKSTVHDFDTIAEVDGVVSCEFEFTNTSKEPYAIGSTGVSCGCTTPEYSKSPVAPGGKAKIKVFFDPKNRPGYFEKSILVVSAKDKRIMDKIIIKGYVIPRPRTMEDDYPVYIGNGLRIKQTQDSLGYISLGGLDTLTIGIANSSDQAIEIDASTDPLNYAINSVRIEPAVLEPRKTGEAKLIIDGSKIKDYSRFDSYIRLRVAGSEPNELDSISINTFVVDNFKSLSNNASVPKVSIDRDYHHFGAYDIGDSTVAVRKFILQNNGNEDLIIRKILSSHPNLNTVLSSDTIPANSSADMVVSFDASGIPLKDGNKVNRLIENLDIISNDPNRPVLKLRMAIAILPKLE